jgi:hypothetical protein
MEDLRMPTNLMPARGLHTVIAAMTAHPWTRFTLSEGPDDAASYCAIAALLRHAGIPHERINYVSLIGEYGPLLRTRYGIPDADTVQRIIAANDGAETQAEAIWRVLGVVSGVVDTDTSGRRTGTTDGGPQMPPAA